MAFLKGVGRRFGEARYQEASTDCLSAGFRFACNMGSRFYLTGFKPFQGRLKNGSQTLIQSLASQTEWSHLSFEILDVSWVGFDCFFERLRKAKPSGVIGFGEGSEEKIVIELVGKNMASGTDEFGVTREKMPIQTSDPYQNFSRIHVPKIEMLKEGRDAGEFLCNYELFHLNTLEVSTSCFVHLPPQGDMPDEAYLSSIEPVILKFLSTLPNIGTPTFPQAGDQL